MGGADADDEVWQIPYGKFFKGGNCTDVEEGLLRKLETQVMVGELK